MSFERIIGWVESRSRASASSKQEGKETTELPILQVLFSRLARNISDVFSSIIEKILGEKDVESAKDRVTTATKEGAEVITSHIAARASEVPDSHTGSSAEKSSRYLPIADAEEANSEKSDEKKDSELHEVSSDDLRQPTDNLSKNQNNEIPSSSAQSDAHSIQPSMPENFDLIWSAHGLDIAIKLFRGMGIDNLTSIKYAQQLTLYEKSLVNNSEYSGDRVILGEAIRALSAIIQNTDDLDSWRSFKDKDNNQTIEVFTYLVNSYKTPHLSTVVEIESGRNKFASPEVGTIEKNFKKLKPINQKSLSNIFGETRTPDADPDMDRALNHLVLFLEKKYKDRNINQGLNEFRKLIRYVEMRSSQPAMIMSKDIPDVKKLKPLIEAINDINSKLDVQAEMLSTRDGGNLSSKRDAALKLLSKCFDEITVPSLH